MKTSEEIDAQYAARAEEWSEREYADAVGYLRHRAHLTRTLGPALLPADRVLDFACGDAGLAAHLPELSYRGVDLNEAMVAAARRNDREVVNADLNDYRPTEPVCATLVFRGIYYVRNRREFFEQVAAYTTKKLIFDFSPRRYAVDELRSDLLAAGFTDIRLRPFLVPQTAALPQPIGRALTLLEPTVLGRFALRFRFTYVCAASGHS